MQHLKALAFAGWTGVDLFFVLSGFLITGILWDARGGPSYFRNFYARRTLRIFPLYYAALAIMFVIVPLLWPKKILIESRHYIAWYATYFVDVLIAWKGFVFAGHFWTLAVEEHFYLLWPLLVHRLTRRTLMAVALFLMGSALLLRIVLALWNVAPTAIYVLTPCRMDGLALGAFLALLIRAPGGLRTAARAARVVLPVSAVLWICLMWAQGGWSQYGFTAQTLGYEVTEAFYASVLVFALVSARLGALLAAKPLRLLGKLSYGLYVCHVFVIPVVAGFFALGNPARYSSVRALLQPLPGTLLLFMDGALYPVLVLGISIGVASLSWHILERPCLSLKRFFPYGQTPAA